MSWVSLITDLGFHDPYLGVIKANIWSVQPSIKFIDITHSIKPHDIVSAGWILKNTYKECPKGTIHLVNVLTNFNNNGSYIVFQYDGYTFVGPNNGVFSLAFDKLPTEIYEYKIESHTAESLKFILTSMIDHIVKGKALADLGDQVSNLILRIQLQPVINKYMIRGSVIYIDQFENVVLNITRDQFEKARGGRRFSIFIKRNDPINIISKTYQDVSMGEALCHFNAFDYLEISVNGGSAASLLGLHKDEMIQIDFAD